MQVLFERLNALFSLEETAEVHQGLSLVRIDKEHSELLLRHLRDHEGYVHLSFFTALDYIEEGIFRLVYMLHNYDSAQDLTVQTDISRDNAVMQSIHPLWKQAATYQRELKEMFGIEFPGSPRQDEPFLLEGWYEIPPMRRDFDTLKYCQDTFPEREGRKTYDPREYMQQQLYPQGGQD